MTRLQLPSVRDATLLPPSFSPEMTADCRLPPASHDDCNLVLLTQEQPQLCNSMATLTPTVASGASPRINPRPQYPPLTEVIAVTFKDIVWQAGVLGGLMALALQPLYQWSRDYSKSVGIEDKVYFAIVISFVHTFVYLTNNFFWQACDSYGWLSAYKLERKPYMIAKPKLMKKMAFEAAVSQMVTGPIIAYFLYPMFLWFGMPELDSVLPQFGGIMKQLMIGHIFNDVAFYCTHRLFHTKTLYRMFHKQVRCNATVHARFLFEERPRRRPCLRTAAPLSTLCVFVCVLALAPLIFTRARPCSVAPRVRRHHRLRRGVRQPR